MSRLKPQQKVHLLAGFHFFRTILCSRKRLYSVVSVKPVCRMSSVVVSFLLSHRFASSMKFLGSLVAGLPMWMPRALGAFDKSPKRLSFGENFAILR